MTEPVRDLAHGTNDEEHPSTVEQSAEEKRRIDDIKVLFKDVEHDDGNDIIFKGDTSSSGEYEESDDALPRDADNLSDMPKSSKKKVKVKKKPKIHQIAATYPQTSSNKPQLSPRASISPQTVGLGVRSISSPTKEEDQDETGESEHTANQAKTASHKSQKNFQGVSTIPRSQCSFDSGRSEMPPEKLPLGKREITTITDTDDPVKEKLRAGPARAPRPESPQKPVSSIVGTYGSSGNTHREPGSSMPGSSNFRSDDTSRNADYGSGGTPFRSEEMASSNFRSGGKSFRSEDLNSEEHDSSNGRSEKSNKSSTDQNGHNAHHLFLHSTEESKLQSAIAIRPKVSPGFGRNPTIKGGHTYINPNNSLHSTDEVFVIDLENTYQLKKIFKLFTIVFSVYAISIYILEWLHSSAIETCVEEECSESHNFVVNLCGICLKVISVPLNIVSLIYVQLVRLLVSAATLVFDGVQVLLHHPIGLAVIVCCVYTALAQYF